MTVNQQANGGQWNLLGTFELTPGQNHRVVVTNNANGVVVADAIQFEPTDALPNRKKRRKGEEKGTLPFSHGYQPYSGGVVSFGHIWEDTMGAGGGPLDQAYEATRDMLRRFKEICPCVCE